MHRLRLVLPYAGLPTLRGGQSSLASGKASRRRNPHFGFTVVELMLAVAIVGIVVSLATTMYQGYRDRLDVARAVTDIITISASVGMYKLDYGNFPADLAAIGKDTMVDPWGNPYGYVSHTDAKGKGKFRKDKNINPINSDFDLWSNGKDGKSVSPLTANFSRDDIIRANDGAFVGLASDYDP